MRLPTPASCPYTLDLLRAGLEASSYLVRENDGFEYPNIFVKVYHDKVSQEPIALILSDSGTGLDKPNRATATGDNGDSESPEPARWNIATLLESTLNKKHTAPYIVVTTHCHLDHICGIKNLQDAGATVTVYSSSHDKAYIQPWENLQKHSLCEDAGISAPRYPINWINDGEKVSFVTRDKQKKESSITVLHTPGHTPDSLSWYDHETLTLCVGDMLYEKESKETKSGSNGKWPPERPMPVIFQEDSSIKAWDQSMSKLLAFVRSENAKQKAGAAKHESQSARGRQNGQGSVVNYAETLTDDSDWCVISTVEPPSRVVLCCAHVTVTADAERALSDMDHFMNRVKNDKVPKRKVGDSWLWDDDLQTKSKITLSSDAKTPPGFYKFSVKGPQSFLTKSMSLND